MKPDEKSKIINLSQIIKSIDLLPFACAVVDENFCLIHINAEMSNYLQRSKFSIKTGEEFTKFLPENEAKLFSELKENSRQSYDKNFWRVFSFKNRHGDCIQMLISRFKMRDERFDPDSHYILIGIPTKDIHLESAIYGIDPKTDQDGVPSNKYQSIFNNAIIGIVIFDDDHCIEEVNQTFSDQFNVTREEIIGKKIEKIFSGAIDKKLQNLIEKVNRDGLPLAKDVIIEERDFNIHTMLEISVSKFRNPYDTINKNMMIVEDITKEKETHKALIQSEKLALTGRLAASLAHEINNPLQASIGCLGLVDEILEEQDKKADLGLYINMALDELKRAARIVKKLRDLHRKSDISEKVQIDVKRIIDDVLILAKNRMYDRNIVPVFPFQGKPPIIMAERDQIQSVILNIVMNAIDAMPNGGYIYIDIDYQEDPKGIIVKIRDTGEGVDQNIIDHLFDPFITTKDDGIGLGLYLSNEIIKDHGGHIQIESKVRKGTIFKIWLPTNLDPEKEDLD